MKPLYTTIAALLFFNSFSKSLSAQCDHVYRREGIYKISDHYNDFVRTIYHNRNGYLVVLDTVLQLNPTRKLSNPDYQLIIKELNPEEYAYYLWNKVTGEKTYLGTDDISDAGLYGSNNRNYYYIPLGKDRIYFDYHTGTKTVERKPLKFVGADDTVVYVRQYSEIKENHANYYRTTIAAFSSSGLREIRSGEGETMLNNELDNKHLIYYNGAYTVTKNHIAEIQRDCGTYHLSDYLVTYDDKVIDSFQYEDEYDIAAGFYCVNDTLYGALYSDNWSYYKDQMKSRWNYGDMALNIDPEHFKLRGMSYYENYLLYKVAVITQKTAEPYLDTTTGLTVNGLPYNPKDDTQYIYLLFNQATREFLGFPRMKFFGY